MINRTKKMVYVNHTQSFTIAGNSTLFGCEYLGNIYELDHGTYIVGFDCEFENNKQTYTIKTDGRNGVVNVVCISNVHSRQSFQKDVWNNCAFYYGSHLLPLRNYTKELNIALTPYGGIIEILYELWSGDTHLGIYHHDFLIT